MKQVDYMRMLVNRHGHNQTKVCAEYAAAERRGEVTRRSNKYKIDADEYARRLYQDGTRKGWLK